MTSLSAQNSHILLVGCGNMGGAMLSGWLASERAVTISIIDPFFEAAPPFDKDNITLYKDAQSFADQNQAAINVAIIAVKPQILEQACAPLAALIGRETLIVSIAAGVTLDTLGALFSDNHKIIRAMPNTPAQIGEGMTVLCSNTNCSDNDIVFIKELLSATGLVLSIDDENLMNAVTAISGSGPAYLFHMIEALESAAIDTGLPPEVATQLARQTIIGSAALAKDNETLGADQLRKNVTSPGGTTEAALTVLMDDKNGLSSLMKKAAAKAVKRGEELGRKD